MAEQTDTNEKTLEPTEKRLADARRKGDVPSSRETGNMVIVIALLSIIAFVLPYQTEPIVTALAALIEKGGTFQIATGAPGIVHLGQVMSDFALRLSWALAPLFGVLLLGAAIGVVLQGEVVIAFERIKPKLSKVSPKEGLKRLFSANSLVEFVKSIIKVCAIGFLAVWFTLEAVEQIWLTSGFFPEKLAGYLVGASQKLLMAAAILLIPVAVADTLWRRFDWRRKQRMSQKDLKDEIKESEGAPEIRQKRAQRRRELSHQRTVAVVPIADVILTNPTHYSVALKYDPEHDMAPVCIAKGADLVALRIREIAFAHDVPVVENKPLARLLYDTVEIDQAIPAQHWQIVAEIISFVFDLKKNIRRAAPAGSVLRTE